MYALIQKTFYIQSFCSLQTFTITVLFLYLMYITKEAQCLTLKMKHILIFIQWSESIDDVQFQQF